MNSPSSLMLQETEQSPAVVAGLLEKEAGTFAEIARIFRDNDAVFGNGISQNHVVEVPSPSDVTGMDGRMFATLVEPRSNLRRDALIDEELHSSVPDSGIRHPRPPRRAST